MVTIGAFSFNAVFGFAVAQEGRPDVRLAIAEAKRRLGPIAATGGVLGLALGLAVLLAPRAGEPWFAVSLGIVIGLIMAAYVAVPSRLVGSNRRPRAATASPPAPSAACSASRWPRRPTSSAASAC